MAMAWRAMLAWCGLFALEALHGVARTLWLMPRVGDIASRQIGVATGSLLVLAVAWFTARWIAAPNRAAALGVGALWVALTLAGEIALGRGVFGYPWARMLEDFVPARGGLLIFGLLVMFVAPWLAARLRGLPGGR
jgi:hypothetical protein